MPVELRRIGVIVLEDNDALRDEILVPGLQDFGFDAAGAASAGGLYRAMLERRFDLAVLDIGLPDESGLSVVAHLRKVSPRTGVVMLTANRGRDDQVRALSQGADAFLRKPVDIEVLALTLRNLAQRLAGEDAPRESAAPPAGRWRLQSDGWCLAAPDGRVAPLTASERSVMRALDARRGRTVAREALIAALVEDVDAFDPHRLEMLMHRLRRKAAGIADKGQALPLKATRGVGYLLAE
ncbi:response regulator transcription factor [Luteimonas sp. FCS-9]|uniref:response regulator transcription factor n=1 Tax=Luteimonas sp. FCS-9 TaxID=1547516 RepID=UPI00063E96FD|nr:response regulator transcription factor [Luteimonas sp. FCS-9]KLJ00799.1 PhoP family transcriptional regulator [Luteimonas sp. FCS-9]